jgi:hypothetical protein
MKIDTPFYPQKWDLEKWKELGFESFEDAEYWEGSSCGILCLKMAHETFLKNDPLVISEYVQIGQKMKAYTHTLEWSHEGLARVASNFGLQAITRVKLTSQDLKYFLDQKSLVIISTK